MYLSVVTLITFLAGTLVVLGLYSLIYDLVLRDRRRVSQRLQEEFRKTQSQKIQKSPLFKDLARSSPSFELPAEGEEPTLPTLPQRFALMIEQADLDLTPQRLLALMGAVGLGLGALVGVLSKTWWIGLLFGLAGAALPALVVHWKRNRRQNQMLAQLPDAFELIGRLIRAGQTMGQAFQGVAEEFRPPISAEFAYCQEQQNLGLSPDIAMRDLGRRVGLVEMKIFVLAVMVQRQTGGNLGELIDNLALIVRERFRIKGKIRVLTAEGRMEASVLLALPPVVFALIYFLNPAYASVLFEHPKVLWGMGAFMLLGLLWIRKIINFQF